MSDEFVDNDVISAIEGLNQGRRAQVSKTAEKALPKYIRSIESSEVVINVDPSLLPFKQVDYGQLLGLLRSQYRLHMQRPKRLPELAELIGVDVRELNDTIVAQLALEQDEGLDFRAGRFPTGAKSFVPIQGLNLQHRICSPRLAIELKLRRC